MKNSLLNEISRIKYLNNYFKGRVISEQVDYDDYDQFDLLVNYFRYVGDKKYTLDVNGSRFYADDDTDRFVKITLRKQSLYLFYGGDVKKLADGKLTKVGTWEITQDALKQNPIFTINPLPPPAQLTPAKPSDPSVSGATQTNATTDPATQTNVTTDPATQTNATTDPATQTSSSANTQTDPAANTSTTNVNHGFPIKVPLEKISFEENNTQALVRGIPDVDVISPIDGSVYDKSDQTLWISNDQDKINIMFYGITTSLKMGDKVTKGQNLGKTKDYSTIMVLDTKTFTDKNVKDYFKL